MSKEEALEFFYQGIEILENAGDDLSTRDRRDAISLLSLATKKADNVFPRAHSLLAMLYYEHEDSKSAEHHASTALEQDEDEFRAQFVKMQIAADKVQVVEGSVAGSIMPRGIGAKHLFGSVFRAGKAAVVSGQVAATQIKFKNEVNTLIEIFQRFGSYEELPAIEFTYCAGQLMSLADFIVEHKIPMPGGKPNIFSVIANSSTENIVYDEEYIEQERNEVNRVKRLAEGRSLSFR